MIVCDELVVTGECTPCRCHVCGEWRCVVKWCRLLHQCSEAVQIQEGGEEVFSFLQKEEPDEGSTKEGKEAPHKVQSPGISTGLCLSVKVRL